MLPFALGWLPRIASEAAHCGDMKNAERSAAALDRFERLTAWPMLILSVAVIPLLVVPLVMELSAGAQATVVALDWFVWSAFALEYGIRLYLAPRRLAFFRSNLLDLAIVVLPFLRPLRILRSARALRALRAVRVVIFLARGSKAVRAVLTRHKLHYALVVTLVVVVAGAVLVSEFERVVSDANIRSFPDALWWAMTTVTTVGYGDRFPVTAVGRGIAVVLMVLGIALFGLLAGSLASFFIESRDEAAVDPKLAEIAERLDRIESKLAESHSDESTSIS
jgi:voltage-gated potassium channel